MTDIPESSKGDIGYALTKAGLSMIPIFGGAGVELFQLLIQSPLDKRRVAWMHYVGEKLIALEETGVRLEDLEGNEEFVSVVMQSTQVALRTHRASKHEALRNAILNVAAGQAPEDLLQSFFITCIDNLSELHLRILKVLDQPTDMRVLNEKGINGLLEQEIPDFIDYSYLYESFCKELYARDLANAEGWYLETSEPKGHGQRTTVLGKELLRFISEPGALTSP